MEKIWEGIFCGKPTELLVKHQNGITEIIINECTEGILVEIFKGALSFAKAHPFLTGFLAAAAWDAVKKYNEAKKSALKFYAKEPKDRSKYITMIKELEKDGFRIVNQGYVRGTGYFWELNR